MDDKTLQAVTALADKLGTTAEYLFGVLIKQAPISGALSAAMIAILLVAMAFVVKIVWKKTNARPGDSGKPEWLEEDAGFAWAVVVLLFLVPVSIIADNAAMTVAAFANPEYWALMQILK